MTKFNFESAFSQRGGQPRLNSSGLQTPLCWDCCSPGLGAGLDVQIDAFKPARCVLLKIQVYKCTVVFVGRHKE
jgi:hypothetical protein